jgi:hypothetical protein
MPTYTKSLEREHIMAKPEDVEAFLNRISYEAARGLAADMSGAVYSGEESSRRYWYVKATEEEIKSWLRFVLNQEQMPDTSYVEGMINGSN